MVNLELSFDEYIPLRDVVFKTLREAIITGRLQTGERLMEIKLANELGVSRTPVREAIRKLEQEGMVIITARRGAEVAPINGRDLKEVLEIRGALEGLVCQLACDHATKENIKKLKDLNNIVEKAVKAGDIEKTTEADVDFHNAICAMTENKRLEYILGQLKEHVFRYRREYIREMRNKNSIIEEHNKIITAIADGNKRAAKREIEKHIETQEKYILSTLSNLNGNKE